jgi:hypothetical protein
MKTKLISLFFPVVAFLLLAIPTFAHHGASVYESQKVTTLKGTVTGFRFMNPHTELSFDVKSADGKVEKWTAEAASLVTMSRMGWTRDMFKPGDAITVSGNRAKNGSFTMRLSKVVTASGKEYNVQRGEDYADQ